MGLCAAASGDAGGTLFNLVGFQTNLKFPEQRRVFRMIPGLEQAEIVRYGVMHRNSFIDSPRLLVRITRCAATPNIFLCPVRSPAWRGIWSPP